MATVRDLLERYRVEILPTLSERTQHDYSRYSIPKLLALWGDREADSIEPREFGEWLWSTPKGRIQRTRTLAPLAHAYNAGFGMWWMCKTRGPFGIKKPKSTPRRHLIKPEEYCGLVRIANEPVALAMAVALLTGQRQGDVLSLRWDQIKDGKIHFVQGKTGKELNIGLTPQLKRTLGKCWMLPGGGKDGGEYVIVSRRGTRYSSCGFRSCYTRLQKKATAQGIRRSRFHDLRKLAASSCADIKTAQELLGHENSSMTVKHYWMNPDESPGLEVSFDPLA